MRDGVAAFVAVSGVAVSILGDGRGSWLAVAAGAVIALVGAAVLVANGVRRPS